MTTPRYVLLAVALTWAHTASAQDLSVASSTPIDGAVGVSLQAEIEFRLTDPLPAMGTEFTEKVLWSPREALRVDRYGHAQDNTGEIRIIFYEVEHQPETDYTFVLHGIRDARGDVLDRPFVLNYTTAPTAGTAVVSGSVEAGEGSHTLEQTVILLLRSHTLAETSWDIARAAVADASGSYTVQGVRPGTYWPLAVHFADAAEEATPSFGIYDADGDRVPDSLVVTGDVTAVELVTRPFAAQTAQAAASIAYQAAETVSSDLVLAGVFSGAGPGDVSGLPGGVAHVWSYAFCAPSDAMLVDVDVTSVDAMVYSQPADTDTVAACQQVPVPEIFVDSDLAMETAEANGGAAFRARYPEDEVPVFLSLGDLPFATRPPAGVVFWAIDYVSPPGAEFDQLTVFVDAATGVLLEGSPVAVQDPTRPRQFGLAANYPNPFNPQTTIRYEIGATTHVRLTVFDVRGRTVAELVDGVQTPGTHRISWDASGHPGGVYWYRLQAGDDEIARSMVYVK